MHHLAATKHFLMFCDLQLMLVWQNANAKMLKAGHPQRFLPPPSARRARTVCSASIKAVNRLLDPGRR